MTPTLRVILSCASGFTVAAAPTPNDEPLAPDQAFRLSGYAIAGSGNAPPRIDLRYDIEPGHYLYKDRFRISAPHIPLGPVTVPEGIENDDPFVGRTRILKGSATLEVPLAGSVAPGTYVVKVTAQGCAEDRICYAPFTQSVAVVLPAADERRP